MNKRKTEHSELWISVIHTTGDNGLEGGKTTGRSYDPASLEPDDELAFDNGSNGIVRIVSVSDTEIKLVWLDNEINVEYGHYVEIPGYPADSTDNGESLSLLVGYHKIPTHKELVNRIIDIGTRRNPEKGCDSRWDKHLTVHFVDIDIARGNTGMWVAKALLESSDDWSTLVITDFNRFRSILLEGINAGTLSPSDLEGWDWMETASKNNDPELFMEDMDKYYDLLADASENGVLDARDILDMIWEPENCQEED